MIGRAIETTIPTGSPRTGDTPKREYESRPGPWASATLLLVCFVYVSTFWGKGLALFPSPLDGWHEIYYRHLSDWWRSALEPDFVRGDADAAYRATEAYLLGLALPIVVLFVAGRRPRDVGLRRAEPGSAGQLALWLVVAAALGIGLAMSVASPWGSIFQETMELASMLPEHFLVFGVVQALALPGVRLANLPSTPKRTEARTQSGTAVAYGVIGPHFVAIACATAMFAWIHVGLPWEELALSVPVGLLFAYLTLRSRSIWPALVVHWALNIVPMALLP